MPSARTPRRNGPYAPLSAFYADDDAVIELEDAGDDLAELLFLRGLAHCAREPKLNGYISLVKVRTGRIIRRPAQKLIKAAGRLVEVGLWTVDGDGGWKIKRWEKWNATHDEIIARQVRDAARKGSGSEADSARNDGGTEQDSALQGSTRQGRALQGTANQGSSSTSNPPPPQSLPADIQNLAGQLATKGITVAWQLDEQDQHVISQAITRCGTGRLVKHAQSRYRPDNPAFTARAFLAGWATMPAPKPPDRDSQIPCHHGAVDTRKCALCRAEQQVAV